MLSSHPSPAASLCQPPGGLWLFSSQPDEETEAERHGVCAKGTQQVDGGAEGHSDGLLCGVIQHPGCAKRRRSTDGALVTSRGPRTPRNLMKPWPRPSSQPLRLTYLKAPPPPPHRGLDPESA